MADAVAAQDDMKVIGVSKTRPNYEAKISQLKKKVMIYTLEFLKEPINLKKQELK